MLWAGLGLLFFSCSDDDQDPEPQLPVLGSCLGVNPGDRLTIVDPGADQKYLYETSGGGRVLIDWKGSVNFGDVAWENLSVQFWGSDDLGYLVGNHENLNGKHIRDRKGGVRSFIFPDGTKVTMNAVGKYTRYESISIYDGDYAVHINMQCNTVEYAGADAWVAQTLDNNQPDGETATYEIDGDFLYFRQIYWENMAGETIEEVIDLGSLDRTNPNLVNDYYDDPDLDHT